MLLSFRGGPSVAAVASVVPPGWPTAHGSAGGAVGWGAGSLSRLTITCSPAFLCFRPPCFSSIVVSLSRLLMLLRCMVRVLLFYTLLSTLPHRCFSMLVSVLSVTVGVENSVLSTVVSVTVWLPCSPRRDRVWPRCALVCDFVSAFM